jgi:hypothetical protein
MSGPMMPLLARPSPSHSAPPACERLPAPFNPPLSSGPRNPTTPHRARSNTCRMAEVACSQSLKCAWMAAISSFFFPSSSSA